MILVTGATGAVGSKVVQAPLDRGVTFSAGMHERPLEIDYVSDLTVKEQETKSQNNIES